MGEEKGQKVDVERSGESRAGHIGGGRDGEEEDGTYGRACRKRSGIYSVHVDRGTHRRCAVILNIVTGLMLLYAGARKLLYFVFYLHCILETSV